jgi:hypothetical protein
LPVSYDIYFVRRDPGQSFEDALDETEESFEGDPGPLSPVELEQWDDVLPAAREVLGDFEEFADAKTRELRDPRTGIQLSLFNGEMAIHVPFADDGEQSADVMAKVRRLARAVERVTGLEGYDPQMGEPVTEQPGGASSGGRREMPVWDDEDDGASDGTSTSLPVVRVRRPRLSASDTESDPSQRRPWEFWKR